VGEVSVVMGETSAIMGDSAVIAGETSVVGGGRLEFAGVHGMQRALQKVVRTVRLLAAGLWLGTVVAIGALEVAGVHAAGGCRPS
jgi:hypothetical protein